MVARELVEKVLRPVPFDGVHVGLYPAFALVVVPCCDLVDLDELVLDEILALDWVSPVHGPFFVVSPWGV